MWKRFNISRISLMREKVIKKDLLIESAQAMVIKDCFPKGEYHFIVTAKEKIQGVTELDADHLPLLDNMMELALQTIEKQADPLTSADFCIGFKICPYMDGLNLHVISNDFNSKALTKPKHWNSFHTKLFLPYEAAYKMLQMEGRIEPLPDDEVEKLKKLTPFKCNQCDFVTGGFSKLKTHLNQHWIDRKRKSQLDNQVQDCEPKIADKFVENSADNLKEN